VLAVAVAIVLFLLSARGQERPATVVETVNKVDAHPRPRDDWQPAVVEMAIYGGGQVRTGAESSARLELLEGLVRLSADSIFTVKESVTRRGMLLTTLFLQEGRLWVHLTSDQPHPGRPELKVSPNGQKGAVYEPLSLGSIIGGDERGGVIWKSSGRRKKRRHWPSDV